MLIIYKVRADRIIAVMGNGGERQTFSDVSWKIPYVNLGNCVRPSFAKIIYFIPRKIIPIDIFFWKVVYIYWLQQIRFHLHCFNYIGIFKVELDPCHTNCRVHLFVTPLVDNTTSLHWWCYGRRATGLPPIFMTTADHSGDGSAPHSKLDLELIALLAQRN